ncbi:hypothetical protein [Nocardiopsis sp. MT53]
MDFCRVAAALCPCP